MNLLILTPEKEYFKGEITSITLPGSQGQFQVLKDHAAMVSQLVEGRVEAKLVTGESIHLLIKDGFIEILNNQISLLITEINE